MLSEEKPEALSLEQICSVKFNTDDIFSDRINWGIRIGGSQILNRDMTLKK
jgi:hypothetical protein